MKRRTFALAGLLALLLAPSLLAENRARRATRELEVLARIGGQVITLDDFRAEIERRSQELPGIAATPERRRMLLAEMVRHRALVAKARQAGYDRDPEVVEVFEKMMVTKYSRDHVRTRLEEVEVSDQEVETFYRRHADDYARPARHQAAIVFLAVPAMAADEKRTELRTRAETVLAEARQLDPSVRHFDALARRYSDHRASRYTGGVIGWLTTHQPAYKWEAEVIDALFALDQPGDIAPLVETAKGFYLVRLVDRESGGALPLEQFADGIRHRLLRERREQLRKTFYDGIYAELEVTVDEALLGTLPPSADSPPEQELVPPPLPTAEDLTERPGS